MRTTAFLLMALFWADKSLSAQHPLPSKEQMGIEKRLETLRMLIQGEWINVPESAIDFAVDTSLVLAFDGTFKITMLEGSEVGRDRYQIFYGGSDDCEVFEEGEQGCAITFYKEKIYYTYCYRFYVNKFYMILQNDLQQKAAIQWESVLLRKKYYETYYKRAKKIGRLYIREFIDDYPTLLYYLEKYRVSREEIQDWNSIDMGNLTFPLWCEFYVYIYEVKEGDTIDSLAKQFDLPKERIIQRNGLQPDTPLILGQTLVIDLVYEP